MPASVADHRIATLFDGPGAVEAVRRCLHRIPAGDRPDLWNRLERLERAIALGNADLVDVVIRRTPHGPVRDCLVEVSLRNSHRLVAPRERSDSTSPIRWPARRYTTMRALCAPVNAWASTGLRWTSCDPDTFYGVDGNYAGHVPVPLNWRHVDGQPIGLSRRFWLEGDGALSGEFWLPATPVAQQAAGLAADHAVAPSIGFRFQSDWIFTDPESWDPVSGDIDQERHQHADIVEVSLTPNPQFPTRVYTVC